MVCCTTQGRSINHRGSALPLDRALGLESQRGPGTHHPSARVMLVEPPRRRPLAGGATAPALAVQQTAPPLSHSHRTEVGASEVPASRAFVATAAKLIVVVEPWVLRLLPAFVCFKGARALAVGVL